MPAWFETHLRPGSSAFHHVQLLPAVAAVENAWRKERSGPGIGESARQTWVCSDWVRCHAGACTPVDSEPPEKTPSDVLHQFKLGVAKRLRKRKKRRVAGQMELPLPGLLSR
jgi:hypothetical protein